jgi:hypothetical protein
MTALAEFVEVLFPDAAELYAPTSQNCFSQWHSDPMALPRIN